MTKFSKKCSLLLIMAILLVPLLPQAKTINIGRLLDSAVIACAEKDKKKLNKITKEISSLLAVNIELKDQQHYLNALIKTFNSGKCYIPYSNIEIKNSSKSKKQIVAKPKKITIVDKKSKIFVRLGMGYADNINNGINHSQISVNNLFGSGKIDLQVGEENRPLSDSFQVLRLSHYRELSTHLNIYADVRKQLYDTHKEYNFDTFKVGINAKIPKIPIKYNVFMEGIWLQGEQWGKSLNASLQVPIYNKNDTMLIWTAGLQNSQQVSQGHYTALATEMGLSYQQKLSTNMLLNISAELLKDDVHAGERAGGNRLSKTINISTQYRIKPNLKLETQLSHITYQDELPYSPALFGSTKRDQTKEKMAAHLELSLDKNTWLDLSYVRSKLTDNEILLFDTPWGDYVSMGIGHRW